MKKFNDRTIHEFVDDGIITKQEAYDILNNKDSSNKISDLLEESRKINDFRVIWRSLFDLIDFDDEDSALTQKESIMIKLLIVNKGLVTRQKVLSNTGFNNYSLNECVNELTSRYKPIIKKIYLGKEVAYIFNPLFIRSVARNKR